MKIAKHMKKLLSAVLAAAILLCAAPLGLQLEASADAGPLWSPFDGETFDYGVLTIGILNSNEATIAKCNRRVTGHVTLPTNVNGYKITSIHEGAFTGCNSLISITISDSITSIGRNAFDGCDSLTSVIIGNGVESIGDATFRLCENLTNVTIGKSVTSIGWCAFGECTNLTSITIGNSVTSIGEDAFSGCDSLTSITIGNGVTSISSRAFENTGYYNDNSNWEDGVLYIGEYLIEAGKSHWNADDWNEIIDLPVPSEYTIKSGTKLIADDAFSGCDSLTSVTIPDSVTSIGGGAFIGCDNLTSVIIPNGVTSIDDYTFYECTNLTSITIGNSVTSIGENAFYWCDSLTSVTIPDSVTRIGAWAFCSCDSLTSVIIPNGVTSIDDYTFYECTNLTSITIPDSVTSIGEDAFSGCDSLTSITIGNGVTNIDDGAFHNTGYYNNISNWENGVLYIGEYLIQAGQSHYDDEGNKIIDLAVPSEYSIKSGTKVIANSAFDGCTNLTSITIPDSVTSIGPWAFFGCTSLTSVTIGNSVTSIGSCAFQGCDLTGITIPDSVTSIGDEAFCSCESITVDKNNQNYSSDTYGVLYNKNKTELIQYPCGNKREQFTVPSNVTSIGDRAFNNCDSLTSVEIGNSVTSIGNWVFEHCDSLTSVTIGNSVTSIGIGAFQYCESLTIITIPNGVKRVEFDTFYNCTSLTSVTIPNSVTSIHGGAFASCTSLADVYYSGTEAQWNEIFISYGNYELTNATIHFLGEDVHTHTFEHIVVPSTCTVKGMEYDICTECGETFNSAVLDLAPHTWGEWVRTLEPTATAEGMEKRACTVCGAEETRTVEKLKALVDAETGVEIVYENEYDEGVKVEVTPVYDGSSFQLIDMQYGASNTAVFDISTLKDGVKVQPSGKVTVRIPVPAGFNTSKLFVCYVDSVNGKVTSVPATVADGYVVFETDHFSHYAIVEKTAAVNSVSLGDISMNYKDSTTLKPTIDADPSVNYTVKYESSDPKIAKVDENGKVTAAKKGSAAITCTVTDELGNTVTDTCKVNVDYSFGQWLIIILLFGWIWYI